MDNSVLKTFKELNDKLVNSPNNVLSSDDYSLVVDMFINDRKLDVNISKGLNVVLSYIRTSEKSLRNLDQRSRTFSEESYKLNFFLNALCYVLNSTIRHYNNEIDGTSKTDETVDEKFKVFIGRMTNKIIEEMINTPPRFNSTCIHSNLRDMWCNEINAKLLRKILIPLHKCCVDSKSEFDSLTAVFVKFN